MFSDASIRWLAATGMRQTTDESNAHAKTLEEKIQFLEEANSLLFLEIIKVETDKALTVTVTVTVRNRNCNHNYNRNRNRNRKPDPNHNHYLNRNRHLIT